MDIEKIRKSLNHLYRLFFILACIALAGLFLMQAFSGTDTNQYPLAAPLNATIACLVIAALCRIARDFLPPPTKPKS